MTSHRRRRRAALLIGLAGAITLLVAVFASRPKLGSAPPRERPPESGAPPHGEHAPEPPGVAAPPSPEDEPRVGISLDPRRRQLVGVRLTRAERTDAVKRIRTVGIVRYDETRLADVNLKLDGWVRELYVDYTGAFVRKGQPLFTLYSPALLTTQQEYLTALATRRQVGESAIAEVRDYADRLVVSARERLRLWDLPEDEIGRLEKERTARAAVPFRAPVSGYVIEKNVLPGMRVTAGQTLYRIADLSVVWLEADVYEQDVSLVRVGQRASVCLEAYPGERFRGRVVYVYPVVEEKTRTARVRFELPNRGMRLKPGMYADVELEVPLGRLLTIPADAVLDSGARQIVFVSQGDGYFEPRPVRIGHRLEGRVQVLEGLEDGEVIASGAAFFLDSESQLRAALQSYAAPPAAPRETGAGAVPARFDIAFRSRPDPPRAGRNSLEVAVKDGTGRPVTDAEVAVVFSMPPMPAMNMPAMRSEATLSHAGGGTYRGTGEIPMGGRWDVTVTVSRGGRRIATTHLAVVVR